MSQRWRRRTYLLLEMLSAAAGLAAVPLIVLALLTDLAGVMPFLIGWLALEVALMLVRPLVLGRDDEYRPPQGPVP